MSDKLCRWGILGTAGIARKNWQAIYNAPNATLMGVASRDLGRSQQYIDECQTTVAFATPPRAYGSYEELIESPDIDAVYTPIPTTVRKEWVIRAAEAGKHVMCEKPCGVTVADVEEMIAACESNGVQFMDGVMFMHSKRMQKLRELLDDGESVGDIKRIVTHFTFRADDEWLAENIRTSSDLEPLGALGDLGWYTLRMPLLIMNYETPQRVTGRLLTELGQAASPEKVPVEFSGELLWDGGVSCSFYCSFLTEHSQLTHVSGTRGHLQISDYVLPFFGSELAINVSNSHFELVGSDFMMEEHLRREPVREYSNSRPNSQETKLFENFSDLVLSGKRDSFWPEVALQTQRVMEACLESARSGSVVVNMS